MSAHMRRDSNMRRQVFGESQINNSRKRQHSELPQTNGLLQTQSKKRKLHDHSTEFELRAAFWDNLSRIWLTERALRELNRRNARIDQSRPHRSLRRSQRPVAKPGLSVFKKSDRPFQSAAELLRRYTPTCVKKIKSFARHGGPDLSDLKGYPEPINPLQHKMSSSQSSRRRKRGSIPTSIAKSTTDTKRSVTSGPYDANFQQKLIDNGIYPDEYEYPDGRVPPLPCNWGDINERLGQARASLSPSQFSNDRFREFKRADARVTKENKVTRKVIPIIEGTIEDEKCVEGEVLFSNLTSLIKDDSSEDNLADNGLTAAKPDLYYGARPEQLHRKVRDRLSGHIIPSKQDHLPIVPNFFLEAKGPDGSLSVAGKQTCYDGALGARGIHSLKSYGDYTPVYSNNAYTISSIYHGGTLKMYTTHAAQPGGTGSQPEYYTNQINTWGMTGNIESFRKGAAAFRNARDWAKEHRDEAIRKANERVSDGHARAVGATFGPLPGFTAEGSDDSCNAAEPASQGTRTLLNGESESSPDQLAQDYQVTVKRFSKYSKQVRRHPKKRRNTGRSSTTS